MSSQMYSLPPKAAEGEKLGAPVLRYVTDTSFSHEWNSALHTHTCTELFFITGGHGEFRVEDKVFPIAVNDVVVVNANVPHTEISQEENPLCYIVIGVDQLEVKEDIGGCTMIHLRGQQHQLEACLNMMLQEAREQECGWELICQNLLEIMIQHLARRKDFSIEEEPFPTGTKANRECELVRRYIDNHFKENLCLDELASLAHINKYYLSHVFRKEFGTTPISYLISRRIQESRYLLTDTDHTLSQIAHILGFSSLSYFSQSFRRLEGVSPLEYRRQHRGGGTGS